MGYYSFIVMVNMFNITAIFFYFFWLKDFLNRFLGLIIFINRSFYFKQIYFNMLSAVLVNLFV